MKKGNYESFITSFKAIFYIRKQKSEIQQEVKILIKELDKVENEMSEINKGKRKGRRFFR